MICKTIKHKKTPADNGRFGASGERQCSWIMKRVIEKYKNTNYFNNKKYDRIFERFISKNA